MTGGAQAESIPLGIDGRKARTKPVEPAVDWTEALLVGALRSRYGSNEWAVATQVRDGAGWDRRTFDALAIGLWASRGHEVHGFECKVSRSDWKRELAKPEKAEPLAAFCHRWWVLAPRGIVDPFSLPATWGLLEADAPGGPIRTVVEAAAREAVPPTRGFVAQVVKRLVKERPATVEIEAAFQRGRLEGKAAAERSAAALVEHDAHELPRLRERVQAFEEASGISLDRADLGDLRRIAGVVKLVATATDESWRGPLERLRSARHAAARFTTEVDTLLATAPDPAPGDLAL